LLRSSDDLKEVFNEEIKFLLFGLEDADLQNEFVHYIESNQEKLTEKDISLSGRQVEPTVSNWLKSFFQFAGIDYFDNLAISKFITNSENGRNLTSNERKIVKDILSLYRSIKYFPDVFLDTPVSQWEFIPLSSERKRVRVDYQQMGEGQAIESKPSIAAQVGGSPVADFKPQPHRIKKFNYALAPWVESAPYQERLANIARKHGLSSRQQNILADILVSFMTEKIRVDELAKEIQRGLALNEEATTLLIRDVLGWLIKPVGQYIASYNNALFESLGVKVDEYPDPDNILTILNQIAIVKEAKNIAEEKKAEAKEKEVKVKKQVAEKAKVDLELALKLEEKLKEMYKKVKTDKIKQAAASFPDILTEPDDFIKSFYKAINDRDKDRVIGALWVLAENGKLINLLADDKKIQELYSRYLVKKYGNQVADDFLENPKEPAYLSYFLKHLLVDTLKISSSEAAALTIHLINEHNQATGSNVELIAYGDMESQDFKWRKINVAEGKLVLEK